MRIVYAVLLHVCFGFVSFSDLFVRIHALATCKGIAMSGWHVWFIVRIVHKVFGKRFSYDFWVVLWQRWFVATKYVKYKCKFSVNRLIFKLCMNYERMRQTRKRERERVG